MERRTETLTTLGARFGVPLFAAALILVACTGLTAQAAGRGTELLKELDNAYVEIWNRVSPAVVNVDTERQAPPMPEVPPFFRQFFEDFGWPSPQQAPERRLGPERGPRLMGRGSGFVIDKDGHILTNNHVIEGADKITVRFSEKEEYEAKVVGKDKLTDIALIKIDAKKELPTVALGDSSALRVGQIVMAIGNPGGVLDRTFTVGHVSGLGRKVPELGGRIAPQWQDFVQTDAAINLGNSGGPLVNVNSEVIGINTAMGMGAENIGFAVPINFAKEILPDLKAKGKPIRGYLGVAIRDLPSGAGQEYGVPEDKGAQVQSVTGGSPAEKAGLKVYDVITDVEGQKIGSGNDLVRAITHFQPETPVRVTYFRDKKPSTVTVKLGELPGEITEEPSRAAEPEKTLGMEVQDITSEMAERLGLKETKGVIVTNVDEDSPAAREGVVLGDVILEVNRQPVKNAVEFRNAVEKVKAGDWVVLLVSRQKQTLIVHIKKLGAKL
jgi:serine protease Do